MVVDHELGDVDAEIAHPFQMNVGMEDGTDQSKVFRNGRLQSDEIQDLRVDVQVDPIDSIICQHDFSCDSSVTTLERPHDKLELSADHGTLINEIALGGP